MEPKVSVQIKIYDKLSFHLIYLQFIMFLKKNRVLKKFYTNLQLEKRNPMQYIKRKIISTMPMPESLISSSFVWSNTKQGYKYWDNLDTQWRKSL